MLRRGMSDPTDKFIRSSDEEADENSESVCPMTSLENIVCALEVKKRLRKGGRKTYEDVLAKMPGMNDDTPQTEEGLRREQIKEHVDDLIENSSLHGLSYIFDTRHSVRRVIWFIITVIAFGYSMHKVYQSTVNYFDYPFNTARMRR